MGTKCIASKPKPKISVNNQLSISQKIEEQANATAVIQTNPTNNSNVKIKPIDPVSIPPNPKKNIKNSNSFNSLVFKSIDLEESVGNFKNGDNKFHFKYFEDKDIKVIFEKKCSIRFRNSSSLNKAWIQKFQMKVIFEMVPNKEGDASIEDPTSLRNMNEKNEEKRDSIKEDISIPFYFKYNFLKELLDNIYELNTADLKNFELILNEKDSNHKMKIYYMNYTSPEKNKINIFRTEFIVPCSPEFFVKFMNDIEEQTKLDFLLDKYYIAENYKEETNVIYLSYKKTMISSARDFIYLKHWGKIEKNGYTFWCDTSRSIEHTSYPSYKNVIRGDIIYSGHVVSLLDKEKNLSFCRMYSECDFKANVPTFLSKSFSKDEMKKYTERCINRIIELNLLDRN